MSIKKSSKFGWLSLIVVVLLLVTAVSPAWAMYINEGNVTEWKKEKRTADDESAAGHETRPETARNRASAGESATLSAPASPAAVVAPAVEAPAQDIAQVSKLVEVEHPLEVSFKGSIESLAGDTLVVDGHTVIKTAQTLVQGTLAVGAYVEVEGFLQADQSVLAREIKVEHPEGEDVGEVEFRAPIVSFPAAPYQGTWVVGDYTLTADGSTDIDTSSALPAVGAIAEVKATQQSNGTLLASRIKIEDEAGFENEAEFKGTVSSLTGAPGAYNMLVDQRVVTTDGNTVIIGALANGAFVEVRGSVQPDGSVLAAEIQVEDQGAQSAEKEFRSTITTLQAGFIGTWTFANGETVQVDAATLIDESRGPAEVGALAEVKAIQQGAQWLAVRIQIEND